MTRPVMWNYDKPHRCPECHYIWTYQVDWYGREWYSTPRWWKTNTCAHCGAVFTGRWAWFAKTRDRMRSKINYLIRELKWRITR